MSSLLTTIIAAAEQGAEAAAEAAGEEEHKSELPFFVLGGALAVFAILISVFGFKATDFPRTEGQARGVMAVGIGLTLAAMVSIVYVSG